MLCLERIRAQVEKGENVVRNQDQNYPQTSAEGDPVRRDQLIASSGKESSKLTVSNLIEAIESRPKQTRKSMPASLPVPLVNQQETPGSKQSQSGEVLEKDWAGGKPVKKNRTVATPFDITRLKIVPAQARSGETVTISFEATNKSAFYSIYPVTIKINGQVITAEVISVPPGFTLPMRASVGGAQPGDYQVEVNFATGKFAVVDYDTFDDVTIKDFDMAKLEAEFDRGITEVAASLKPDKHSEPADSSRSTKSQDIIDTMAVYIETGLDKLGDAIIFPIRKLMQLFSSGRTKR